MSDSSKDLHKKLLGKKGEDLVAAYLQAKGCKVLKRNYRTPFGEADLIVLDGDEIAFVEVKTRQNFQFGTPREAVNAFKQRRYYDIARFYWKQTGEEPNARFDVAEVYADGEIEYMKNAF
jgi:putative endonuclease